MERWIKERKGRKYNAWKRELSRTWKERAEEGAEIWEVKEGERMRWEMQFEDKEWPGAKKTKEFRNRWDRLDKEGKGAIEEIKIECKKLKRTKNEVVLRIVEEEEDEDIVNMYMEMRMRTSEWYEKPEKMIKHMIGEKKWDKMKEWEKERG